MQDHVVILAIIGALVSVVNTIGVALIYSRAGRIQRTAEDTHVLVNGNAQKAQAEIDRLRTENTTLRVAANPSQKETV